MSDSNAEKDNDSSDIETNWYSNTGTTPLTQARVSQDPIQNENKNRSEMTTIKENNNDATMTSSNNHNTIDNIDNIHENENESQKNKDKNKSKKSGGRKAE